MSITSIPRSESDALPPRGGAPFEPSQVPYDRLAELAKEITRASCLRSLASGVAAHIARLGAVAWRYIARIDSDVVVLDGYLHTATVSCHPFDQLSELERHWWGTHTDELVRDEQLTRAKSLLPLHLTLERVRALHLAPGPTDHRPRSLLISGWCGDAIEPFGQVLGSHLAGLLHDKVRCILTAKRLCAELRTLAAEPANQNLHREAELPDRCTPGTPDVLGRASGDLRSALIAVLDRIEPLEVAVLSAGGRYAVKMLCRQVVLLLEMVADLNDLADVERTVAK